MVFKVTNGGEHNDNGTDPVIEFLEISIDFTDDNFP